MRTLLKKLIPALILLIGTSAFAEYRIATVDLNRVFTNYWKTKQAQIVIDEKKRDSDKQQLELMNKFNKDKEDYQKLQDSVNDPAVSTQEHDKRKKLAEDKLKDLKDQDSYLTEFVRRSNESLGQSLNRTKDNIISDIRAIVTAKAKADGYSLVLDSAAQSVNGTAVVLYSAPGDNDITEAVIKQINVGAPTESPKVEDKPVAKPDTKTAPKLDDKLMK
jgi:outer membrane protein